MSREEADVARFEELRRGTGAGARRETVPEGFFEHGRVVHVARAPGRLDVMGGIADYSGSLVLELPTAEAAVAGAQHADDGFVRVISLDPLGGEPPRRFEVPLTELAGRSYAEARARFARAASERWAAYAVGALVTLEQERGLRISGGLRLALSSSVPEGKGVSSSAAVEVASLSAVLAAFGFDAELDGHARALACQTTENRVVGAACGVMDPMTASLGQRYRLLELVCQPANVRGHLDVPPTVAFYGMDSGIRHAVSGAEYTAVRCAAFMGYRLIAAREGFAVRSAGDATSSTVTIDDPRWHGYLANIEPAEFRAHHSSALPEHLDGQSFLESFGGTTDPHTRVDPARSYPVRAATAHPVFENERVSEFAVLLRAAPAASTLRRLGELMFASHASYTACGLGSEGTDALVDRVRAAGAGSGLFGAKISGGGSGGTVVVLARRDAEPLVRDIAASYAHEAGRGGQVFSGSSGGAATFGTRRVAW